MKLGLISYGCILVFQTMCLTLWVASYCANILRPLKSNLLKKKKKKKDTNTAMVQSHLFYSYFNPLAQFVFIYFSKALMHCSRKLNL